MMTIKELLEGVATREIIGDCATTITKLSYDSRDICAGSCFFAIVGTLSDGHNYIEAALSRGAVAVVCERIPAGELNSAVCYVVVDSTEQTMSEMASRFWGDPSSEIELVAVTGTNGKTTTATLLADLFEELGYATGLISTVTYRFGGEEVASTHTTPDTLRLNAMLRQMVDAGCSYCFMEVSSHSVVQRRIAGLRFAGAVFTNLTHDHLDYHKTFMEYLKAKKGLFDALPKDAFALVNLDDRNGEVMVQNCAARVVSYSLQRMADLRAKVIEMHFDGMLLSIDGEQLWVQLLGRFNAYNLLAIYGVARELGIARDEALVAMSRLSSVSGRFEHFNTAGGRTVIVDYAHTPDALSSVLATIDEIGGGGRNITTVCGCGGERDKTKRPEMARIAYEGSTTAIFTSDNPRGEDPEQILSEMVAGVAGVGSATKRWLKIGDRAEAIRTAVMLSGEGDVILIAGKGHETYQIIGNERLHFDDREVARDAIKQYLHDKN